MQKLSLILRWAAVAAGLVATVAWFTTHGILDRKEVELDTLSARLTAGETDLDESLRKQKSLQSQLKMTRADLAAASEKITRFQDRYYQATEEVSRLEKLLASEKEAVESLVADNNRLEAEILTVQTPPVPERDPSAEIEGYQRKIDGLKAEIQELQSRLTRAPTPTDSPPAIRAAVAALRLEEGMVVFDRGAEAGILPDREYALHKNGTKLGRIRVTALSASGCVGMLISSTGSGTQINIGDPVLLTQ